MLTWDVFGYYLYLPSHFIYSDLGLINQDWLNHIINTYEPSTTLYQAVKIENGNWVIKYTMGLSILYAPFFFFAHLIAEPLGYPADGFSLPYQYSITIGGLIYAIIGLIYFAKVLLQFFDQYVTSVVLIIIFFGTNYFHLTIYDGTILSHNFLFTIYAILTYYTIKWYSSHKIKYALIIGFSVGLITLIRPTEGICVLIPLLWHKGNENYFKSKLLLIKSYFPHLIIIIICVFITLLPQLLYWEKITGEYLFYSYTNPGEGLDFLFPHTFNFLFSFRKGWFIYTPIMVFAFIGLYYLYKKYRPIFYTICTFIVIDIYLSSSWSTWWYAGGSFSSRSLVPAYVLLAIPIGVFVEKIRLSPISSRVFIYAIFLLLILINLFQSWQFENNILSKERMTMDYYFSIFGKTQVSENDKKLLLVNRATESFQEFNNTKDYQRKLIYENTFNDKIDTLLNNNGEFFLDENNCFSPGIDIKYKDLTNCDHTWIKVSAKVFIPEKYDEAPPLLVACFNYKNQPYQYRTYEINKAELKYNDWNEIKFDYLTPEVRTKEDNLKIYLWHRGKQKIMLDDFIIYAFEPKNRH
ncbi:MAG: hypothetical protein A3K10_08385 [Bacteroidetes bacterium RIFCSPLOWO2_12_FULL_31_6]|nr:MAG: hypothetical protein A3K10_08385 [Bacteroidetes bacterium RIFCSPLOWO2_12_FULL_31_6]